MISLGLGLRLGNSGSHQSREVPPVKYLFIDGGFLDAMIEKTRKYFGLSEPIEYRYENVTGGFTRSFYYDAYPTRKTNQSDEQYRDMIVAKERKFRKINLAPGVHTREGITRNRTAGESRLEQKGVDILLAVDVFRHATHGNMSEAHIMTTDIDFFPLFDALRETRVSTHLHCYPRETSEELMFLADKVVPVNPFSILRWCRAHAEAENLTKWIPASEVEEKNIYKQGTFKNGHFWLYRL
jgi:uncharacterized LabA/DUF88 family protein